MRNNILSPGALLAVLLLSVAAPVFANNDTWPHMIPAPDAPCPPIDYIEVEILSGNEALFTWSSIQGVSGYVIRLFDENQNVLLDTTSSSNQILLGGFVVGEKYKVKICYICEQTGKPVCNNKIFRYIIIDEHVVMFDAQLGFCDCTKDAPAVGSCPSNQSPYYSLASPRVYNIRLADSTSISLVCKNTVNPLGNCQLNLGRSGVAAHGANSSVLPFFEVGSSIIHFHGTTFCIDGELVQSVTYCEIESGTGSGTDDKDGGHATVPESIYPNPFSDLVIVNIHETKGGEQHSSIRLYNARGQLVLQEETGLSGAFVLHTEHISPGLYWLSIQSAGRAASIERMLKMK